MPPKRASIPHDCRPALAAVAPEPCERPEFAELYERYFSFVWRSLRLLGVRAEAIEDASQDVFAVVARQLEAFEGRSSVRTWLFGIVQRVAANHRRTRRRKLEPLQPLEQPVISNAPSPDAQVEAQRMARGIEEYCAGLGGDRRDLFILALVEGVPVPELTDVFDVPLNTLYSRIRALRSGLKLHLGLGREDEDG